VIPVKKIIFGTCITVFIVKENHDILLTKWFSDLEELDPPLNPLQGGDLAL